MPKRASSAFSEVSNHVRSVRGYGITAGAASGLQRERVQKYASYIYIK